MPALLPNMLSTNVIYDIDGYGAAASAGEAESSADTDTPALPRSHVT